MNELYTSYLNLFKDCYDNLPAVNSDTSLPIKFNSFICSFPNYRYSFIPYDSKITSYFNDYEEFIEKSYCPYGYEFEECFIKHELPYRVGTNTKPFIYSTNKALLEYKQFIKIIFNKKYNCYAVKSSFDTSDRIVFFKESCKLIEIKNNEITWKAYKRPSSNLLNNIRKELYKKDNSLAETFSKYSSHNDKTVIKLRAILNNSFYKNTQATYILDTSAFYHKHKCKAYYHIKKDINRLYTSLVDNKYSFTNEEKIPEKYLTILVGSCKQITDLSSALIKYSKQTSEERKITLSLFEKFKKEQFDINLFFKVSSILSSFPYWEQLLNTIENLNVLNFFKNNFNSADVNTSSLMRNCKSIYEFNNYKKQWSDVIINNEQYNIYFQDFTGGFRYISKYNKSYRSCQELPFYLYLDNYEILKSKEDQTSFINSNLCTEIKNIDCLF